MPINVRGAMFAAALLLGPIPAGAGTFESLYDFQLKPDLGQYPGPVTADAHGVLYGTVPRGAVTAVSGQNCTIPLGCGAIFRYVPGGALQLIHIFTGPDGAYPRARLHLKGETLYGISSGLGPAGSGVLFSVKTDGSSYKILHAFQSGLGDNIAMDGVGNIFGVTARTIFHVKPDGFYSDVYTLDRQSFADFGVIASDRNGDVLGSFFYEHKGVYPSKVFRYDTAAGKMHILYETNGGYGLTIAGIDQSGIIYGYTQQRKGQKHQTGSLFALLPSAEGYQFNELHRFRLGDSYPTSLHVSPDGTLTGTAISAFGRRFVTYTGTLFQFRQGQFTDLHKFYYNDPNDGSYPESVPTVTPSGQIFGTTVIGGYLPGVKHNNCARGAHGCGTIYTYVP